MASPVLYFYGYMPATLSGPSQSCLSLSPEKVQDPLSSYKQRTRVWAILSTSLKMAHDDTASEDWSISRSCSTAYSTNKSFTSTDSDSDSETLSSHSTKLNVLIYVQHCRTLKTFTPAEQQEVLNTMPFAHEIKCKLDHVGPIAAIYLDISTTKKNIATGETSQAITPSHFSNFSNFFGFYH